MKLLRCRSKSTRLLFCLCQLPVALQAAPQEVRPQDLMPTELDHTWMWWADGFPSHSPGAPWRRVVQSGHFAFALDTETLQVPHLGPVPASSYDEPSGHPDHQLWQQAAPAEALLTISTAGKTYRCTAGGKWNQFSGPRLIESGRFVQRADVTDLEFRAKDGSILNTEARLETIAWPDRLALLLSARPGIQPIQPGDTCFGRVGGGFGLDGTNHLEIPHQPEYDLPRFTLQLWTYVPADCAGTTKAFPWLVCRQAHEEADGHYGLAIIHGKAEARLNIGGGKSNAIRAIANAPLAVEAWNHLALTVDGETLRIYQNGTMAGSTPIGRDFQPKPGNLTIGRRQDNCGDGYHFRGAVDEISLHNRALTTEEIRKFVENPADARLLGGKVGEWRFRDDVAAATTRPRESWNDPKLEISLLRPDGKALESTAGKTDMARKDQGWMEAGLNFNPRTFRPNLPEPPVEVAASNPADRSHCPVDYDPLRAWHRVNLDGIEPIIPEKGSVEKRNDALERVSVFLKNSADSEQTARLLFEKAAGGIRQRIGSPITGLSAVLRFPDGMPTGIPVQLSKNWHGRPEGGVHAGTWFHGFSMVRLPPKASVELELVIAYGHWGGVPAASHAQLCLVGWGSNQLWEQSALGSWGESICYEPDQVQANCSILDVRPLMVRSMSNNQRWQWTHNVGGGDFVRLFNPAGQRVPHTAMRSTYLRQGPCLTEIRHAGRVGPGIRHQSTVSLARSDDITRGIYQIRFDVIQAVDFSRFVIFQIGADTYSYTGERMMALGDETGLRREWQTHWGGDTYRTKPVEAGGRVPWISLHRAVSRARQEAKAKGSDEAPGAWANRGIVIRSWKARLGGREVRPWIAERGVNTQGTGTSTIDLVPPPDVTRLLPGDFVETTLEHLIVPQHADDYHGPNESLRTALRENGDTWRMIHREAVGGDRQVEMRTGTLGRLFPSVTVQAKQNVAEFTLRGGLAYVAVSIEGLDSPRDGTLIVDGKPLDQSIHGNDFWQTDHDPVTRRWTRTYNVPASESGLRVIRFAPGTGD